MTIQSCPVEVLDNIFEYSAYLDPRNAQRALFSLMLTCSHFRVIAKRHFIRVVCLPSAVKVNSFYDWLQRVVECGDYGKGMAPIQHLAVAGDGRCFTDAEAKARGVFHLIITTAAPSLLTLALFDMDNDRHSLYPEQIHVNNVPDDTTFPKLRDLIALKQGVIHLVLQDDNKKPNKQVCQLRYPSLRRLYIPSHGGSALPSTLPYLDDLRLLDKGYEYVGPPSREELGHVRSLIIDFPGPKSLLLFILDDWPGSDEYNSTLSEYRTLIKEVGNPECNGVVVPISGTLLRPERDLILSAWADAVVGGEGCWTTAWAPTTTRLSRYEG
jgi:hypothetical protein